MIESTNPKVSVIIPFFSHKEWLNVSLESVFAQTFQDFEVILVNDGSDEDISGLIKQYGDRIIYRKQQNKGPGAARNLGIKISKGKYIAFEDSDDIWLPDKLERQINFMEKCGAKWCHSGFMYWWPQTGKVKVVDTSRDYDDVFLQRHVSTKIATPCVVIDKSIYSDGNFFFPEDIRNGEDGVLYTKLSRHYKLALVQEPLAKIRMRGNNSQSHALERFNLAKGHYKKLRESGEKYPFFIHLRCWIYIFYAKLLGTKSTPFKELVAKCLWTLPYLMERVYVRYLYISSNKDEKYIERYYK